MLWCSKNTEITSILQQEKKCHARHNCLVFLFMKGHSKLLKISHQQTVLPKWWHVSCLTLLRQKIVCLKAIDGQLHRNISHLFSTDWEDCHAPAALTRNVDYPSSSVSQWNKTQKKMRWWNGIWQEDRLVNEWLNVKFKVPFKNHFAYPFIINLFIIQMPGNEIELLIGNNHGRHPSSNELREFLFCIMQKYLQSVHRFFELHYKSVPVLSKRVKKQAEFKLVMKSECGMDVNTKVDIAL